MRILLPIIQFPPDVNTTGLLMAKLCEGLVSCGHEVSVITAFPHYENFKIRDDYRGKFIERSQYRGMNVTRLYIYAHGKKTMVNRLVSYISYNALAATAGILSRGRWDVILCPNGSFFTGLSAWLLEQIKPAPFIYNVQDVYPDVPIRAGQLSNPYAIALLRSMENFMYRKAAHITVITPTMRENLLSKGVPAEKLSVIPNFVDTDFIHPLPKVNVFGQANGLSDKFVVAYVGNLGYGYDLDTLLDVAFRLRSIKGILFVIMGNGVAKPALEKRAAHLELENLRFMPFHPYESMPVVRASSDVQVCLYKTGAAIDSFPSKIYEIMASGRALIASADANSEVDRLVKAAQCGICVLTGNAEQLAEEILKLYKNPSLSAAMGQSGRQHAEQYYSKRAAVSRYNELLENVVAEKKLPRKH